MQISSEAALRTIIDFNGYGSLPFSLALGKSFFSLKPSKYCIFLCAWCFIFPLYSYAQENWKHDSLFISVEVLDYNYGLSQSLISSIVIDSTGFIWLSTKDGLNRFDGKSFKVFRSMKNQPYSLTDNHLQNMVMDKRGWLWTIVREQGLCVYDPSENKFHSIREEDGLASESIDHIRVGPEGEIIIEYKDDLFGHHGFHVLVPGSQPEMAIQHFSIDDYYPGLAKRLERLAAQDPPVHTPDLNPTHRTFMFDAHGTLWVLFPNKELHAYASPARKGDIPPLVFNANQGLPIGFQPDGFFFDYKRQEVFLLNQSLQILKLNRTTNTFEAYAQLPTKASDPPRPHFSPKGDLWVQYGPKEVRIFYISEGRSTSLLLDKPVGLTSRVAFDDFGNLWVSSNLGLSKINWQHERFKNYRGENYGTLSKDFSDGNLWTCRIENPKRKAFYDQESQNAWIRTENDLFKRIRHGGQGTEPTHLAQNKDGHFLIISPDPQDRNESEDKDFYLWSFDPNSDSYERIGSAPPGRPGFYDRKGHYWLEYRNEKDSISLFRIDFETGKTSVYPFPTPSEKYHYRFLSDWEVAPDGRIYLGTVRGLFIFEPDEGKWEHFTADQGDDDELSHQTVLSLCLDPVNPDRFLWIGTEGGGLNRFDLVKRSFIHFSQSDGLPNDVIYGILADNHQHLWISTNQGLSHFNPVTFKSQNFNSQDGLVHNEFNRYHYSKSDDGSMCFGTVDGITVFHPDDFYRKQPASNIVFTGLKIVNTTYEYLPVQVEKENAFQLPKPIQYCDSLCFNHNQSMITFEFALLDHTSPKGNIYRYKMEGFDQEWISSGAVREATYTNLNPGTYRFKVQGQNSHHVWSAPKSIHLTILPPWWDTLWFKGLMLVALILAIYSIYRYRLAQWMRVERMRNQIAQDLHDEIGSTLSSIGLYSAVMQKSQETFSPKTKEILENIVTNTSGMMEQMNDLVWTIKSDNDYLEQVINRMRAFGVSITEPKDIRLHFTSEDNLDRLKMPMDDRKNLYLLFKEAANNAVKHSGCNNLFVAISKNDGMLRVQIRDDGQGFDPGAIDDQANSLSGNGLNNIKFRAQQLKATLHLVSEMGQGTTIELNIPI